MQNARLTRLRTAVGAAAAGLVLGLLRLTALLLSPFRLGRLLSRVSIPRLETHRLRTSLTVMGVALGVAVLVAVVLVNDSILRSVTSTLDHISGKADLQLSAGNTGFDAATLDAVAATPGVYKAAAVMQQTTFMREPAAPGERLMLLGIDMLSGDDAYFRTFAAPELAAIERDPLPFLNSKTHVIITQALAQRLGHKVHDEILLSTPRGTQPFEIYGILENDDISRAFGGAVGLMYYPAMQAVFERGNNIDRIDIAVQPGQHATEVAATLQNRLGEAFTVERPSRRNDRVASMLAGLRTALTMASLIGLFVGAFLIYNTMSISVAQRKREIGILRALGATLGQIRQLFTLEGFLLGFAGSGLGVGIGVGLAHALLRTVSGAVSEIYIQVAATSVHLDPLFIAVCFCGGVGLTALAAAIPAHRATSITPREAMTTAGQMRERPSAVRFSLVDGVALFLLLLSWLALQMGTWNGLPVGGVLACGTVLLAGALLTPRFVRLLSRFVTSAVRGAAPLELRLANDNLPRDLARTSVTAAALMVSVSMATAFAVFIGSFVASTLAWVDQSVPADLFVTSAQKFSGRSSVPVAQELGPKLAELPGVADVERARVTEVDYGKGRVQLLALESEIYGRHSTMSMTEGDQQQALAKVAQGAVMVSDNFARRMNIGVGDKVSLSTRNAKRSFEVSGVMLDYTSDFGTILMDRAIFIEHWADRRVDVFKVYAQPGADLESIRSDALKRYGEAYDLFVLTNREFKSDLVRLLDQVFSIMAALELIALVIAVFGVVNALSASVLDRIREIGVLRAVGMLQRQLRKVLVFEAALIGVVGSASGVVLGLIVGYVLLRYVNLAHTGWNFPYRPRWTSLAGMSALVVAVSAAAGWYPARVAAAQPITDALERE